MNHSYVNCKKLPQRVVADNPKKVYIAKAEEKCKPGHYKVMMFVAPGNPNNYFRQGDFHFYKQVNVVEYKLKKGNTHEAIAKFFKVPVTRIKKVAPKIVPGKIIRFKANIFAHKRGWATGPLLTDAKGNVIIDPRKASRDYGSLNYKTYCSSFCVKNKGIKVGHTHTKVRKKT
jgi:LysM repeat protein